VAGTAGLAREVSLQGLRVIAGQLQSRLDRLLAVCFTHEGNPRSAEFLREHLHVVLANLCYPGMAATNYRAQQAVRPTVLNRKAWGGNRTWPGAGCFAAP